jgi:hypothetical protein
MPEEHMSERDEPYRPVGDWSADQTTVRHDPDDWREQTTPGITPVHGNPSSGAGATAAYPAGGGYGQAGTGYGQPGSGYGQPGSGYGQPGSGYGSAGPEPTPGYGYGTGEVPATTPEYSNRPVAFRRPDALAALLLVLAGIAAGVSLLLHWVRGNDITGWGLLRRGFDQFSSSVGEVFRSGFWQPLAIVGGGALLFVLGLLMFIPARTHRFLGVLAFLVALAAGAGVLVALSGAGWQVRRFDLGFWFGAAVPVLGVLGALKAALTGPRLGARTHA